MILVCISGVICASVGGSCVTAVHVAITTAEATTEILVAVALLIVRATDVLTILDT